MDYPLLENLAKPCHLMSQRMAGIRIENDRIIRLLEVLMHIFLLALQLWEAMLHSKWGWLVPIPSRFRMRQAGS